MDTSVSKGIVIESVGPRLTTTAYRVYLEGVAAKWLLDQGAFRHNNYALELEYRLRSRKQGADEQVMSYYAVTI